MTDEARRSIGIDVSQATLDVAVFPTGEQWQVSNDDVGIGPLVERLTALAPDRIVLEATAGYELPLLAALGSAGMPVVAANPGIEHDAQVVLPRDLTLGLADAEQLAEAGSAIARAELESDHGIPRPEPIACSLSGR